MRKGIKMSLSDYQKMFSIAIAKLILHGDSVGYSFRFGDAWRSTDGLKCNNSDCYHTYQDLLVFNKKSKESYSRHNDRLAIDLIIERKDNSVMTNNDYMVLGNWWEKSFEGHSRWGGRFGVLDKDYAIKLGWDAGHFEWSKN